MPKVTFIGAGSTVFAKQLMVDILSYPELSSSTLSLMDINERRLETSYAVAHRIAQTLGVKPRIECSTDRRAALEGANYVISMIQVGPYQPTTLADFDIPRKYGLRQTIGDTIGIGGIMRGLRTIPVLLDIAHDMEELCPQALLINYANPMVMNTWALTRASNIRTVGLCHSVPHTASILARDAGVPAEELDYLVAGINHMAFFLKLEHNGKDLYPELRRVIAEGRVPKDNRVRYEVLKRLGYFVTESSEHFAEYVPWFIKRDRVDLIGRYNIPLDEYPRRCEAQIAGWRAMEADLLNPQKPLVIKPSNEYCAGIIHSMETGSPRTIYGNVPNDHLIDGLPAGCPVEVPCLVDRSGIHPQRVGALPPQLTALIATNVNVHALTVEAALTRSREHIYHAAMLDPHTAADLDLDSITKLVDELITAHAEYLPVYN